MKQERNQRKVMLLQSGRCGVTAVRAPIIAPGTPKSPPSAPGPALSEEPESHPPCYSGTFSSKVGAKPLSQPGLALSPGHPGPWEKGSCPGPASPRRLGNARQSKGTAGKASTQAGSPGPAEPSSVRSLPGCGCSGLRRAPCNREDPQLLIPGDFAMGSKN